MLYTKCMYAQRAATDGLRICVMSRLTENDGHTPATPLIRGKSFDYWMVPLAPPPRLVGAWYRNEVSWEQFECEYKAHARGLRVRPHLDLVLSLALDQDVTLLCVEETAEQCHRRLLAEVCKEIEPRLEVRIA